MLRNLMTEFDRYAVKNNVYKVYTIGGKFYIIKDCYVCLGMNDINIRNPVNEALNMIKMAFNMVDII